MRRQSESSLREQIVQIGRLMYDKGYICASDGNISARLAADRMLITPSGLHKGLLQPEQLLLVDGAGQVIGPRLGAARDLQPTSELPMHLEAYRQRPDIGAVVHAHPPITVALSIAGIPLADCLLPEVIVTLGLVPTTAYATPSSEENVRAITDLIPYHDALVLQRHGSLTVGQEPVQAFMRLETVEQSAHIGFMLAQLGVHNPLPAEEVRKLLEQRARLGLSRPGEAEAFCTTCGVCHSTAQHLPTLRPRPAGSVPPPVGQPPVGHVIPSPHPDTIRALVAQVVHQALGQGG